MSTEGPADEVRAVLVKGVPRHLPDEDREKIANWMFLALQERAERVTADYAEGELTHEEMTGWVHALYHVLGVGPDPDGP